jgi:hypothetical protein
MSLMPTATRVLAASLVFVIALATAPAGQKSDKAKAPDPKRPKINLKARPDVGIAPVKIVFTAELSGGSDDFEEYYCPTTVWEWGDGTVSESSVDCPPYEAGKSQIKRRDTAEHTYKKSGRIRVYVSLKHRDKEVAAAGVNITVQPGGLDNSN